ncbi:hypothetical protein CC1G_04758 [Coprinopsis cinerea okayama7|uniref:C2H2-type domain-containing protein n=1 Tax=Coprinopsis cinerea (strain Okayama-7 / 130 / ATCC MYA-4618 / FGSC 9003) TaxID=240176 RepID=A8P2G4_COPC7|nr:hypothetical protein CC1G_04758 [Coprinopsis cinerea okayama7\|eukprot:XP_001838314.2 hypothetical protein CC1G_04758 [Coprinopsis cinerea okayama7\
MAETQSTTQPIALPTSASHSLSSSSSNPQDFSMDVGSFTGSSSGPFNPASYTRHFIGSPISWRAGSYGMSMMATSTGNPSSWSSRFPVGSPTHQLLSSWEAGKTPSSLDADRSILNALNVFDREGELCRNYTCCGLHLSDLHALLEHFEEVHIVVVDPNNAQSQAHIQVPFNPQVNELSPQQQMQQRTSGNPSAAAARNASAAAQFQQHLNSLANTAMQQNQQFSQFQNHQPPPPTPFDPDDMELELDLDNGVPPPTSSLPPSVPPSSAASTATSYSHFASSSRSSPSSGAPSPPDTPITTPLSAYPSPHAFVPNHLPNGNPNGILSPYISQPSSPLSGTAASTRQNSPTGFGGNAQHGTIRPNLNLNLSYPRSQLSNSNVLAHPEDAFNTYARFASDYSSCLPGAQFNGASRDEWERVHQQQQNPQDQQVEGQQQSGDQPQMSCLPPALLFAPSGTCTPASTPGSRVGSPSPGQQQQQQGSNRSPPVSGAPALVKSNTAPATPTGATSANGRQQMANGTSTTTHHNTSSHHSTSSTSLRPAASLLLSKPFRCPKPNCNKSYKQANGLKYHMTHGSCNFAPPKDLEHVKDLLERKRREREAKGAPVNRPNGGANDGTIGGLPSTLDTQLLSTYYDLNLSSMNITETELREVEREAEKRLRPFACGVGDCQRRYKNMNGLRYHYQHSGDHGAVGLALLASGQHECLQNGTHGRKNHHHHSSSSSSTTHSSSAATTTNQEDEREGRKRHLFKNHSASVPVSRAGSRSRTGTPIPVSVPVTTVNSANTSPKSGVMPMNAGSTTSTPAPHTSTLTTPIQVVQVQQVNGVGINTGLPPNSGTGATTTSSTSSSSLSQALGNTQPLSRSGSQPGSQSTSPSLGSASTAGVGGQQQQQQQQYTQQQQQQIAAAAYQQYAAQMQRQYQAAIQAAQQQQQQGQHGQQHQHGQQGMYDAQGQQYASMDMS